jgi:hypothetical protein
MLLELPKIDRYFRSNISDFTLVAKILQMQIKLPTSDQNMLIITKS